MKKVLDDKLIERAMREAGRLAKEGGPDIRAGRFVPPSQDVDEPKIAVAGKRR